MMSALRLAQCNVVRHGKLGSVALAGLFTFGTVLLNPAWQVRLECEPAGHRKFDMYSLRLSRFDSSGSSIFIVYLYILLYL